MVIILIIILLILAFTFLVFSHKKKSSQKNELVPFDPVCQEAVIKASICTGEKVAGIKDKETGHFTEVMLVRSAEDEKRFKKMYGLTDVKTEY